MRCLASVVFFVALVLIGHATADDSVSADRIKVFLFGAVAFGLEVTVDMRNNTCHSLDNNLIDGMVKSVLVGGPDVSSVLSRDDGWYCVFYDNYACNGTETEMLVIPSGENNLKSSGWHTRVHGLQCINEGG
ncbi:hypothetical protein K458DRAFT_425100 [Lentithecium fluviatile CBS 122367]|uniref:Uncharacterized protein n=1 Tax=Lentithecium fluviatile CBS 122367 TaxID=1168545 RepID=A0A6G1ICP5_9PLEO|nr:hypothetical protein K458DRAFT_425100 [Lentithecium fluviatile CBS 122367]